MTRRVFLASAGAAALSLARHRSAAALPRQTSDVTPLSAADIRPGRQHRLNFGDARDGWVYVPRGYKREVPAPLMVLLHGAGNGADSVIHMFPMADERGVIVLAPDSRDWTWDGVLNRWGPDVEFIATALKQTTERCAIDMSRVALAGISDGASYALSLGIGQGDLFTHLIAFSPGVARPVEVAGKPRVFISHGTRDGVMPIDETSRSIVRRLKGLGYDVTYREFDGGHSVPDTIAREAFDWFVR